MRRCHPRRSCAAADGCSESIPFPTPLHGSLVGAPCEAGGARGTRATPPRPAPHVGMAAESPPTGLGPTYLCVGTRLQNLLLHSYDVDDGAGAGPTVCFQRAAVRIFDKGRRNSTGSNTTLPAPGWCWNTALPALASARCCCGVDRPTPPRTGRGCRSLRGPVPPLYCQGAPSGPGPGCRLRVVQRCVSRSGRPPHPAFAG